jgi:hypothetical protein
MSDTAKGTSCVDVDVIASHNPRVDKDQLGEARALLATIRESGVKRPAYRLSSPYEARPIPRSAQGAEQRSEGMLGVDLRNRTRVRPS